MGRKRPTPERIITALREAEVGLARGKSVKLIREDARPSRPSTGAGTNIGCGAALGGRSVRQVWPEAGEQRCWNHKMRNVLDRLPQREQSEAKDLLRAVVCAPSRAEAVKAREVFARRYRPWYPKAVDVLEDDWERMVAFYDFPEDHWKHLRTTNVVESPFAALRLRTTAAKRFKRVESATALIWKLLLVAEKRVRRLDAPHLLKDVFEGRKFEDGKPVSTQQRKNAA